MTAGPAVQIVAIFTQVFAALAPRRQEKSSPSAPLTIDNVSHGKPCKFSSRCSGGLHSICPCQGILRSQLNVFRRIRLGNFRLGFRRYRSPLSSVDDVTRRDGGGDGQISLRLVDLHKDALRRGRLRLRFTDFGFGLSSARNTGPNRARARRLSTLMNVVRGGVQPPRTVLGSVRCSHSSGSLGKLRRKR